jgi:DNA processing protein
MNAPRRLPASSFPEELADLQATAPKALWILGGDAALEVRPRVAIVGTRRATSYGLRVARELGGAFARAGACVVSGMASGIDGAAHRGVLEAGGTTIAVLANGVDEPYPKSNRDIYEQIARTGAVISELPAGSVGYPSTFLERNRIIAALASLTIVVEAPHDSGAMNTANHAMGLGRDVAVVPGQIDQPQSQGSNSLMMSGAQVITTVEDALALVGLTPPLRTPRAEPSSDEGLIWKALADGALDIDTLCHRSGLPAAQCLAAVTRLELAGSVECALTGEIRRR